MIRRSNEKIVENKEHLFQGDGPVTVQSLLNGPEEMYHKGRTFAHTILETGSSIGFHIHQDESETYYIIKGVAEFNDNGEMVTLYPGDVAITPSGTGHGIRCISQEPLEVIALILFK